MPRTKSMNENLMNESLHFVDTSGPSRVTLFTPSLFSTEYAGHHFMVNAISPQEAAEFVEPQIGGKDLFFKPVIPAKALKTTWSSLYVVNARRNVMTGYALNAEAIAEGSRDGTAIFRLLEIMPQKKPAIITEALLEKLPRRLSTGECWIPARDAAPTPQP